MSKNDSDIGTEHQDSSPKPYAMVGAGKLAASIWKSGDRRAGWHYRFTLFRMNSKTGAVQQRFAPRDIADLVKLARVLAAVLADDGCLELPMRQALRDLVADLDTIFLPEGE